MRQTSTIIQIMLIIIFSYILFSFQNLLYHWKISIISVLIILLLQFNITFFIKNYYQKIIKNNSIFFTILSLYVYSVTLFFFFAIIIIKIFKIII